MIRFAAVGDVHFGDDSVGTLRPHFEGLGDKADLLLMAGDLTRRGDPAEASALAREMTHLPVPAITVLGNHDYHLGKEQKIREILTAAGVLVLEGESVVFEVNGCRVGVAGVKGFGGGFAGSSGTEFGEQEMKAFIAHSRVAAERLEELLEQLTAEVKIALLHYSPIRDTLVGEPVEIYPFLGSYLLAEAVDRANANFVLHGHAHRGSEKGATPGGITVRNVAQPVIKQAFKVYLYEESGSSEGAARGLSLGTVGSDERGN